VLPGQGLELDVVAVGQRDTLAKQLAMPWRRTPPMVHENGRPGESAEHSGHGSTPISTDLPVRAAWELAGPDGDGLRAARRQAPQRSSVSQDSGFAARYSKQGPSDHSDSDLHSAGSMSRLEAPEIIGNCIR
jgi:hypothetical protein